MQRGRKIPFYDHFWEHRDGFIREHKGTLCFPSTRLLNKARAFLGVGCRHISAVHLLPLVPMRARLLKQKDFSFSLQKFTVGIQQLPVIHHTELQEQEVAFLDKNIKDQSQASSDTTRLCSLNLWKRHQGTTNQSICETTASVWRATVRPSLF